MMNEKNTKDIVKVNDTTIYNSSYYNEELYI